MHSSVQPTQRELTDSARCDECSARLKPEGRCWDDFETLLQLEWQIPGASGSVLHFYLVNCSVLQHPVGFNHSAEALALNRRNLADLLDGKITLEQLRGRTRERFAGAARITRPADAPAQPAGQVHWPITAADVPTASTETYAERVTDWAQSIRYLKS